MPGTEARATSVARVEPAAADDMAAKAETQVAALPAENIAADPPVEVVAADSPQTGPRPTGSAASTAGTTARRLSAKRQAKS